MANIITSKGTTSVATSPTASRFLARIAQATESRQVRFLFGFDATASRQQTWDAAIGMQGELVDIFPGMGTRPEIRMSYFRGNEFKTTEWTRDTSYLQTWMREVRCVTGSTQIRNTLLDAIVQAEKGKVSGVFYVGDAVEENQNELCDLARKLQQLKVPVYLFQEGDDSTASRTFSQIAEITGGRHRPFGPGCFDELKGYMKVAMAHASGNQQALEAVRRDSTLPGTARLLLEDLSRR